MTNLKYKMLMLPLLIMLAGVAATSSTEDQCCEAPGVPISSSDPRPNNMAFIIGSQKSGEYRCRAERMAG